MFPECLNVRTDSIFVSWKKKCLRYDWLHVHLIFIKWKRFGKTRILCFNRYQLTKQRQWKSKKTFFWWLLSRYLVKMPSHLKGKSCGALDFIGTFAIKLCTNHSHNLIMKMTQQVTSQSNVNDNEKQNCKMEAIWYLNVSVMILLWTP